MLGQQVYKNPTRGGLNGLSAARKGTKWPGPSYWAALGLSGAFCRPYPDSPKITTRAGPPRISPYGA